MRFQRFPELRCRRQLRFRRSRDSLDRIFAGVERLKPALAYNIGQRKFQELRERATRELGARFDIRAFHDAVLADGALPLDVLEARVEAWIAQRKASAASNERRRVTP